LSIKIKVEYEIAPLRRAEMICPECGNIINLMNPKEATMDYCGNSIHDRIDLRFMDVKCTTCGFEFNTRDKDIELEDF
jgi:hypothetical protein